MKLMKRYKSFFIALGVMGVLYLINHEMGMKAFKSGINNIRQMLMLLPPIFILLGLMDVWVPKETMMKLMGENSGIKGTILAFLMGSFTSGPLYGAFPVATVLMKKGVTYSNILIFIGAWSTTKIPMLLFEGSNLGWKFALLRLLIDIPGIVMMANIISGLVSEEEKKEIYARAEEV